MEVMTAMFVVSVGLVTVIKIFSSGFINSATDRDRIVAAGLAQEGLEIVKNIRDNSLAIPGNFGFEKFYDFVDHNGLPFDPYRNLCGLDYMDVQLAQTASFDNSNNGASRNCFDSNSNNPARKYSLLPQSGGPDVGFMRDSYNADPPPAKWARAVYIDYQNNNTETNYSDDSADVTSIVWWSGSASWPDVFSSGNPTNLSNCTAATKCVYAKMHLDAWKP